MPILLLFAFLSGLVTIAAPCIWPLLPVVLSTSALTGRRRPLGVTLGILLSFGVVTLSVSYLVHLLGFDVSLLRTVAVVVLVAMGAVLLVPALGRYAEAVVSRFTGIAGTGVAGEGFWAGFASGLPVGIVWAPCAGPILATIATLAATREVDASIILVTAVYLAGIAIPLLLFASAGQHIVQRTRSLGRYTGTLQRVLGAVVIATAGLVFFDWDTRLQAELLDAVPSYQRFLNDLEGDKRVTVELNRLKGVESPVVAAEADQLFNTSEAAPEFAGITRWLNLAPRQQAPTLESLRGKVVLVEFWTYTCINCIRALPHTSGWYEAYKDDGLIVIGVHTPEFAFERDASNVERAIERFDINFPIAQDNNYATWQAYRNLSWPAKYLIDRNGTLRRVEYGEGEYDDTELAIRALLEETGAALPDGLTLTPDETPTQISSPESFLGADRMINYYPVANIGEGEFADLVIDPGLTRNTFNFGGDWVVMAEYAEAGEGAALEYRFHGRYVYLVAHQPEAGAGTMRVLLDGAPVRASGAGADVLDGDVTVDADRLYELVDMGVHDGQEHVLRLEISAGVQLYAFTFG